jgi:hypothetical protein
VGVYFRAIAMASVTIRTAWELQVAGHAKYTVDMVSRAVWRTVYGHELVHFGCDYAGATFEVVRSSGLYRNALPGPFGELQEPIATAVEMQIAQTRSVRLPDPTFRAAFTAAWQQPPLPSPYDHWVAYATPGA